MKSEKVALLIIAIFHLAAQAVHNHAHVIADVRNTLTELLFIIIVVTVMPWVAIVVAWKFSIRKGAAIFSLSMAASFLFGYFLHFVVDGPDLHSNVIHHHNSIFFHSAMLLALLEFAAFIFGLYVFLRSNRSSLF